MSSCLDFQFQPSNPKSLFSFNNNKPQFSKFEEFYPFSKPFLSSKSLEMCTESLGSETGSGIGDQFPQFFAAAAAGEENCCGGGGEGNCGAIHRRAGKQKKAKRGGGGGDLNFPPPLTSISGGGGGVEVRTHREGGRLVIKAIAAAPRRGCFQAERGGGRLRLSLLKECGGEAAAEEEECGGGGGEEGFGGRFWGENQNVKSNRCNGESSRGKQRLQSLQFCVVGV